MVARLNLPTSRHVDDLSRILRKYDMRKGLKTGTTVSRPSSGLEAQELSNASTGKRGRFNAGVLPIMIKLQGLTVGEEGNPASAAMLPANPIDPTNRLPHFLLSLRQYLATTSFMVNPGNEGTARQYIGDYVDILNTLHVQWWIRVKRKHTKKVPRIDARDLINKYRTYEWGTNIPLEDIRLERVGSMAKCSDGSAVRKERTVDATFKLF